MTPQLSIIIPVLNEAASLPLILDDLQAQQDIELEILLVDGGSTDNSRELIQDYIQQGRARIHIIESAAGRGRQMNRGAQQATAPELLFLHADSRLHNKTLLHDACNAMSNARQSYAGVPVAGHFSLHFIRNPADIDRERYTKAYYFYEAKTHLNRPDCINGDQGMWLSREYFDALGRFDESHYFMEDVRLAVKIFATGKWISLPGTVHTSARRFEQEGLKQRQTLNAIICNFEYLNLVQFYDLAKACYAQQSASSLLQLRPFYSAANKTLFSEGIVKGIVNWYKTGRYVARNSWQLVFALDCVQNARDGLQPGHGNTARLMFYDRWLSAVTTSVPANLGAMLLTATWFYVSWLFSKKAPER